MRNLTWIWVNVDLICFHNENISEIRWWLWDPIITEWSTIRSLKYIKVCRKLLLGKNSMLYNCGQDTCFYGVSDTHWETYTRLHFYYQKTHTIIRFHLFLVKKLVCVIAFMSFFNRWFVCIQTNTWTWINTRAYSSNVSCLNFKNKKVRVQWSFSIDHEFAIRNKQCNHYLGTSSLEKIRISHMSF